MAEHLPSMLEDLGSIPGTEKKNDEPPKTARCSGTSPNWTGTPQLPTQALVSASTPCCSRPFPVPPAQEGQQVTGHTVV